MMVSRAPTEKLLTMMSAEMNSVYVLVLLCLGASHGEMDADKPLLLTPYIEQGHIATAQHLSRVGPLPGTCTSVLGYSGFITVNKQYNSNLFFWFIPAQETDPKTTPFVLFLDGGPGTSSLFGLFLQTGPYKVTKHNTLTMREFDWSKQYSMLYVDQPVGTGFSFADDDSGYARSEDDIARDMYNFLMQFFTMFPTYLQNDFYLAGESYAGRYISYISHKIHTENPTASRRINMKGLFIGGAFMDSEMVLLRYGDYMYQVGILNTKERNELNNRLTRGFQMGRQGRVSEGVTLTMTTLFGQGSWVYNVSGYTTLDNFLIVSNPPEYGYANTYIQLPDTRRSLHAGSGSFHFYETGKVFSFLSEEFFRSTAPYFGPVLSSNQYKIMLLNGQLDIIVLAPGVLAYLDSLSTWPDLQGFRNADKKVWRLTPSDTDVAGYVTSVGKFKFAIVREAGHYVPLDQPERTYDLFTKFVNDHTF